MINAISAWFEKIWLGIGAWFLGVENPKELSNREPCGIGYCDRVGGKADPRCEGGNCTEHCRLFCRDSCLQLSEVDIGKKICSVYFEEEE